MGGTSAIETIACVKAMQTQILPPTINQFNHDDNCDLDYVPNEARDGKVNVVVNNATGFGGHYARFGFAALEWRVKGIRAKQNPERKRRGSLIKFQQV